MYYKICRRLHKTHVELKYYYAASITQIKKQTFDNNLRDPSRFLSQSQFSSS